jgi:hypothetical protein
MIIPVIILIFGNVAFATSFTVDKLAYKTGEEILLSGSVSPIEEGSFISVQILNPPSSDFVQIDTFLPDSDGAFSRIFKADGPKWVMDGIYTLKLFYNGQEFQTTFEYSVVKPEPEHPSTPQSEPTPEPQKEPKLETPESEPEPQSEPESIPEDKTQEPKTHIHGFPALDKAPQYYFDRYSTESSYKEWFDLQFPGRTVNEVVGYEFTHVSNFPDYSKSPQYYIDRYQTEQSYKEWFDLQFPGRTIYEVLGFPNPIAVPEWIKSNAEWWSRGQISDIEFISGIEHMIKKEIITIPNLPASEESSSQDVPAWVRNNASWWALDQISEEEFVNGIKYLIEKGIIIVN